jgi:hypothetical protein
MRRATVILIGAIMALMLVHIATTLSARTPEPQDVSTIQIITPADDGSVLGRTGGGDGGDADDLAGHKGQKSNPTAAPDNLGVMIQARMAYEVWRMHFFFVFGLYR